MNELFLKQTRADVRGMYFVMMCFGFKNGKTEMFYKYRDLYRKEANLA